MVAALAILFGGVACGGGDAPTAPPDNNNPPPNNSPASLQVSVSTDGTGTDADGYAIRLDGGTPVPVAANGTVSFTSLEPRSHTAVLSGNDGRCYLLGARSKSVTLSGGQAGSLAFQVRCFTNPIGFEQSSNNASSIVVAEADGSFPTTFGRDAVNAEPLWSPDGSRMAFAFGSAQASATSLTLALAEPAGGASIATGITGRPRAWSPDGSKLIVAGASGFVLYDVTAGTGTSLGPGGLAAGASFSPDGSKLMINHIISSPLTETLWVGAADGTGLTKLAGSAQRQYLCQGWSADGSEVYCFAWSATGTADAFVAVRTDGSGERTILGTQVLSGMGVTWVAAQSVVPGDGTIVVNLGYGAPASRGSLYTVAPNGSGLRDASIAPVGAFDYVSDVVSGAFWSGASGLLFVRQLEGGPDQIRRLNAQGTGSTLVYTVPPSSFGRHAQWIP